MSISMELLDGLHQADGGTSRTTRSAENRQPPARGAHGRSLRSV